MKLRNHNFVGYDNTEIVDVHPEILSRNGDFFTAGNTILNFTQIRCHINSFNVPAYRILPTTDITPNKGVVYLGWSYGNFVLYYLKAITDTGLPSSIPYKPVFYYSPIQPLLKWQLQQLLDLDVQVVFFNRQSDIYKHNIKKEETRFNADWFLFIQYYQELLFSGHVDIEMAEEEKLYNYFMNCKKSLAEVYKRMQNDD